jgi:hypothetical protein
MKNKLQFYFFVSTSLIIIYKLKTSEYTPGGRGPASSNLVIPTKSIKELRHSAVTPFSLMMMMKKAVFGLRPRTQ